MDPGPRGAGGRSLGVGRAAVALVAGLVASAWGPDPASACSCSRGSVESALAGAALVAEIEIVEVGPPGDPDSDMTSQRMRARVIRVFSTETAVSDGDEIVLVHQTCNSTPYGRDEAGARYIAFLGRSGGRFTQHYCSFDLPAWGPIPHLLVQARRRWLARR